MALIRAPQRMTLGFLIGDRVFAHVLTGLRTLRTLGISAHFGFALPCAELRGFTAKYCRAVENDHECVCRALSRADSLH